MTMSEDTQISAISETLFLAGIAAATGGCA
jgi:hypothetical protein